MKKNNLPKIIALPTNGPSLGTWLWGIAGSVGRSVAHVAGTILRRPQVEAPDLENAGIPAQKPSPLAKGLSDEIVALKRDIDEIYTSSVSVNLPILGPRELSTFRIYSYSKLAQSLYNLIVRRDFAQFLQTVSLFGVGPVAHALDSLQNLSPDQTALLEAKLGKSVVEAIVQALPIIGATMVTAMQIWGVYAAPVASGLAWTAVWALGKLEDKVASEISIKLDPKKFSSLHHIIKQTLARDADERDIDVAILNPSAFEAYKKEQLSQITNKLLKAISGYKRGSRWHQDDIRMIQFLVQSFAEEALTKLSLKLALSQIQADDKYKSYFDKEITRNPLGVSKRIQGEWIYNKKKRINELKKTPWKSPNGKWSPIKFNKAVSSLDAKHTDLILTLPKLLVQNMGEKMVADDRFRWIRPLVYIAGLEAGAYVDTLRRQAAIAKKQPFLRPDRSMDKSLPPVAARHLLSFPPPPSSNTTVFATDFGNSTAFSELHPSYASDQPIWTACAFNQTGVSLVGGSIQVEGCSEVSFKIPENQGLFSVKLNANPIKTQYQGVVFQTQGGETDRFSQIALNFNNGQVSVVFVQNEPGPHGFRRQISYPISLPPGFYNEDHTYYAQISGDQAHIFVDGMYLTSGDFNYATISSEINISLQGFVPKASKIPETLGIMNVQSVQVHDATFPVPPKERCLENGVCYTGTVEYAANTMFLVENFGQSGNTTILSSTTTTGSRVTLQTLIPESTSFPFSFSEGDLANATLIIKGMPDSLVNASVPSFILSFDPQNPQRAYITPQITSYDLNGTYTGSRDLPSVVVNSPFPLNAAQLQITQVDGVFILSESIGSGSRSIVEMTAPEGTSLAPNSQIILEQKAGRTTSISFTPGTLIPPVVSPSLPQVLAGITYTPTIDGSHDPSLVSFDGNTATISPSPIAPGQFVSNSVSLDAHSLPFSLSGSLANTTLIFRGIPTSLVNASVPNFIISFDSNNTYRAYITPQIASYDSDGAYSGARDLPSITVNSLRPLNAAQLQITQSAGFFMLSQDIGDSSLMLAELPAPEGTTFPPNSQISFEQKSGSTGNVSFTPSLLVSPVISPSTSQVLAGITYTPTIDGSHDPSFVSFDATTATLAPSHVSPVQFVSNPISLDAHSLPFSLSGSLANTTLIFRGIPTSLVNASVPNFIISFDSNNTYRAYITPQIASYNAHGAYSGSTELPSITVDSPFPFNDAQFQMTQSAESLIVSVSIDGVSHIIAEIPAPGGTSLAPNSQIAFEQKGGSTGNVSYTPGALSAPVVSPIPSFSLGSTTFTPEFVRQGPLFYEIENVRTSGVGLTLQASAKTATSPATGATIVTPFLATVQDIAVNLQPISGQSSIVIESPKINGTVHQTIISVEAGNPQATLSFQDIIDLGDGNYELRTLPGGQTLELDFLPESSSKPYVIRQLAGGKMAFSVGDLTTNIDPPFSIDQARVRVSHTSTGGAAEALVSDLVLNTNGPIPQAIRVVEMTGPNVPLDFRVISTPETTGTYYSDASQVTMEKGWLKLSVDGDKRGEVSGVTEIRAAGEAISVQVSGFGGSVCLEAAQWQSSGSGSNVQYCMNKQKDGVSLTAIKIPAGQTTPSEQSLDFIHCRADADKQTWTLKITDHNSVKFIINGVTRELSEQVDFEGALQLNAKGDLKMAWYRVNDFDFDQPYYEDECPAPKGFDKWLFIGLTGGAAGLLCCVCVVKTLSEKN